ncbi:purine-nucleoside phosphorylase [Aquibacillus koreensis]|uniref:Purine nucleoside phosphorylase n=1 Tax=Aquibacillus koreensis TaxID=279446 RepID=A0A9X3WQX7_9BACI|nr:purine-nucleoside phosphorylase [Aquibacillus koreensis]MCT2534477.1 purine-nucleoside phosphorylase [Aquibacillus koreensis]MDC3421784.1 purine-nucleoside phosphorylase [Aquibacillus koreensis]
MQIEAIRKASSFISEQINHQPKVGLILGSGLGMLADEITNPVKIKYDTIPGFPVSTVEGHAGQLVIGELQGMPVLAMQGRFHYYEGYDLDKVTFPVRVMKELGIASIVVTNAAGAVNPELDPGDLMLITDHINNAGANPLIGPNNNELGVRFPDMSTAYSKDLQDLARRVAGDLSISLKEGVYVWNSGPSYETPAEVRMLHQLGADAVGMSTVPEVIVARHAGMEVVGISCISNMAAGILDQPLTHDEVIETTEKVREVFLSFVKQLVNNMKNN